jgi:hypothetical protein
MSGHSFTAFQIVLVLLFGGLLVRTAIGIAAGRVRGAAALVRGAALLAATLAALWPNATSALARLLGIGRGTDLILYAAVVFMMLGFWMGYVRLTELRREITLLVRREALREAAPLAARAREASAPPETPA